MSAGTQIAGTPTRGGEYVLYDVFGNRLEVTSKYVPPIRPIGRGAYGIVCGAKNSQTGEEVAIKKISHAFDNHEDVERTLREIKVQQHMRHKNIVSMKEIIPPPERGNFDDFYIVYELMDTNLNQIIRSNQPLTDEHCQYFMYQLLRGLKYVHSAGVVHANLKPSNLFLNANCDLKIGDFGMARMASETDQFTHYVALPYRAPELLLNCSHYTSAVDIWSAGCILAEMATREPLFVPRNNITQLKMIIELTGIPDDESLWFLGNEDKIRYMKQLLPQNDRKSFAERFPDMSPGAVDLLEKMFVFDPISRICADEALRHPYLSAYHDLNDEPVCSTPFNFEFELPSDDNRETIRELIWRESNHPSAS